MPLVLLPSPRAEAVASVREAQAQSIAPIAVEVGVALLTLGENTRVLPSKVVGMPLPALADNVTVIAQGEAVATL